MFSSRGCQASVNTAVSPQLLCFLNLRGALAKCSSDIFLQHPPALSIHWSGFLSLSLLFLFFLGQDLAKFNNHVYRIEWQASKLMLSTAGQIIIKEWNNKSQFALFISNKSHHCAWTFKVTARKHCHILNIDDSNLWSHQLCNGY